MPIWVVLAVLAMAGLGCSDSDPPPDDGTADASVEVDSGRSRRDAGRDARTSDACDALGCQAPASCDDSGDEPACVCPEGYTLAEDAVSCDDVDECADGSDDCDAHATCTNVEGGFDCACDAPAYEDGDDPPEGKDCTCAAGYDVEGDVCLANDGTACDDDSLCASGNCVSGVCCATACDAPPACKTAEGATCIGGSVCAYATNAADGTACDDGDACTDDVCTAGTCVSTMTDCDDGRFCTADSCDSSKGCVHDAASMNGTSCDDGDICTDLDQCDAGFCLGALRRCDDGDDCTVDSCDASDGSCLHDTAAANGDICEDGDLCTYDDTCMDGTCMRGPDRTCDDGLVCTDDSCNPSTGECEAVSNSVGCDDGDPCTVNDACFGGLCQDTDPRDCSGEDDQCNVGVCQAGTGACIKQAVADGTGCDDGDPCTAIDQCDGGSCNGAGSACGSSATGCQDCSTNPSDPVCQAGDDRICGCPIDWVQENGVCVPDTNECNTDPCGPNTDCVDNDPVIGMGVVCTCANGYEGNDPAGAGCTDIDDCAGNPCGPDGSCVEDAPGQGYHCDCDPGHTEVLGACTCDLAGTFAIEITTNLRWMNIAGVEDGMETVTSWALRQHVYDDQGELTVSTMPCGGTAPDICSPAIIFVKGNEAHNQYLPDSIWGLSTMPVETLTMSVTDASPGEPFVTAETAALFGIRLSDPMGAWPASRCNVRPLVSGDGCSSTTPQTNGATWVNHDDDTLAAVTSFATPPDATPSSVCPRTGLGGPWPWAYWPANEGLSIRRVKRFATGTRARSYLDGTIGACGADGVQSIAGTVKGSGANGQMRNDARVQACVRVSGTGEAACSSTIVDFFDGQEQAQEVTGATFVIDRLDSATSCSDVWSHFGRSGYPPTLP